MRKALALILTLALLLPAAIAWAENEAPTLEELAELEWCFASGVGAWSTDLQIQADGSFTGDFHDSEMGDTGEGYPYGTVYVCSFSGRMTLGKQVDEYSWIVHIDSLVLDEEPEKETIEDEIRYITTDPYGISEGDDMLLYRPGMPMDALSEDMQMWAHLFDWEFKLKELENWFLSSEANDSGFVSYLPASMDNPWEDLTAEQLLEEAGLFFGVPEGAENVIYRLLPGENLAEMQFTWDGDECVARIQPAALEEGELMNIADMYFDWENEQEITIGHCRGTIGQAQTGSEDWVELCLWYDTAPGLMYSLAVYTTDPDGLDLTAIAEQVYIPAQGDD